ncbi:hypothetical protein AO286_03165 [Pseudomonas syringae]|nr:hypothetical protein AO286_03165 [Pseudomonas syringae]
MLPRPLIPEISVMGGKPVMVRIDAKQFLVPLLPRPLIPEISVMGGKPVMVRIDAKQLFSGSGEQWNSQPT